jgi:hypothetical protein
LTRISATSWSSDRIEQCDCSSSALSSICGGTLGRSIAEQVLRQLWPHRPQDHVHPLLHGAKRVVCLDPALDLDRESRSTQLHFTESDAHLPLSRLEASRPRTSDCRPNPIDIPEAGASTLRGHVLGQPTRRDNAALDRIDDFADRRRTSSTRTLSRVEHVDRPARVLSRCTAAATIMSPLSRHTILFMIPCTMSCRMKSAGHHDRPMIDSTATRRWISRDFL